MQMLQHLYYYIIISYGAGTDLYPSATGGWDVSRPAAAEEMAGLFYACAATTSSLVHQHHCLNEYTICQVDTVRALHFRLSHTHFIIQH